VTFNYSSAYLIIQRERASLGGKGAAQKRSRSSARIPGERYTTAVIKRDVKGWGTDGKKASSLKIEWRVLETGSVLRHDWTRNAKAGDRREAHERLRKSTITAVLSIGRKHLIVRKESRGKSRLRRRRPTDTAIALLEGTS